MNNNIIWKDFFQLLVQLHNSGSLQRGGDCQPEIAYEQFMSIKDITAESVIFHVAG